MIELLKIQSLRNLHQVTLDNLKTLNLIIGPNGSGKTSLLEAVHIAGTGRSFRSNQISNVIQNESEQLTIYAQLSSDNRVGVQRTRRGEFSVRINQQDQDRLSVLAQYLPVRIIAPDSFLMLTTGSKLRRQYLDFSVFHVEHLFIRDWQNYNRIIKQRNAQLKQSKSYQDIKYWDSELIPLAKSINNIRKEVFKRLEGYITDFQLTFLPQYKVQYVFKSGTAENDLQQQFKAAYETDRRYGNTSLGPHKADIKILINGQDAHTVLSRGELKMLVISMMLAQVKWLGEIQNKFSCLLIDDLTSELDVIKQQMLLNSLQEIPNLQLFISSIDKPDYFNQLKDTDYRMFHVEQGQVKSN